MNDSEKGVPVFADAGGRRARWTVRVARVVVVMCFLYMGLVLASLVGAPWVPDVALPTIGPLPEAKAQTTPVTLSPTAATQTAPVLPEEASTTTTSTSLPGRRLGTSTSTSSTGSSTSTTTTTRPGRRVGATTTTTGTSTTTTTIKGRSSTAPGKSRV